MGSLIADPWAALGTSSPARWRCCCGGVRTLGAQGPGSRESGWRVSLSCSCQLSVQATQEGLGQIRLHTRAHAWGCLLTRAQWQPLPWPCSSVCPSWRPVCGAGSAGHAEWKQEPPRAPWPCRWWDGRAALAAWFADFHYRVRFSSTRGGEGTWVMRPCWAIRLMAFLLRSDNSVHSIVRFLITLPQLHCAQSPRRRGSVGVVQGRLSVD